MANPDLEKARVRLYEKADRKPAIMATGTALMVLAGFIAFLNLINSINLGFRGDQRPIERFLFWLIVAIIVKSSDAGGDVADVLTMVSHDTKENQLTEDERRIAMSTYIAVIYISFMVFLVTIWILNVTFLPKMLEASGALEGGAGAALAGASPLANNLPEVVFNVKIAFFIAVIVHALGDGVLAGVLDTGKIANGLRHSFIMLVIAMFAFLVI